jgi:hypothetical protein
VEALLTPPETGASTNFKFLPSSRTFADWWLYDHIIESKAEMQGRKDLRRIKKPKEKKLISDNKCYHMKHSYSKKFKD